MATDFFQRQSDARRSTTWLVTMFCLAVVAIVGSVVAITAAIVFSQAPGGNNSGLGRPEQIAIPILAGVATLLIILGGSAYKVWELKSGGGRRVAESLGGRRLIHNTADPVERRLLNVVEEMAIASGTPVPPVFLLDEEGINAFAAGYSPSDAVLGVTRGCAQNLTRDELQGVIAHEFSHVLNGDMRMSIRLIGILHGILLIGLTGQLIFRMFLYSGSGHSRRRSNSDNKGGGQAILIIIGIGIALLILGFIGTFFGNLIKAAVSRQREYLADASAVQFTRNPSGISGALKRIGAVSHGSRLQAAGAAEASHMYFAQGVWEGFGDMWATHPPLAKRIRAIDPSWDGKFPTGPASQAELASDLAAGFAATERTKPRGGEVPMAKLQLTAAEVGGPTEAHRHYASQLIAELPEAIRDATHEPYSARAVVYGLLLDRQTEVRQRQWEVLRASCTPDVLQLVEKLLPQLDRLDVRSRLPLIEMSLPSLKAMSQAQYGVFRQCFLALAKADNEIDLFEWMLSQILLRHLRTQFEPVQYPRTHYYGLQQLNAECSTLLSIVAAAGNSPEAAKVAFAAGAQQLSELQLTQQPRSTGELDRLRSVLEKLVHVSAKQRGRLVEACAAAIRADDQVTWQEAELLRGISDLLDCPMPPLLVPAD